MPKKQDGTNAAKKLIEYRQRIGRKRHSEYTCDLIRQRRLERLARERMEFKSEYRKNIHEHV